MGLLCVMIGASCTPSSGPEVDAEADGVSVEAPETSEVAEVEALEEVTHAEPCIRVVPARIALSYDVRGVQSVALEVVVSCGKRRSSSARSRSATTAMDNTKSLGWRARNGRARRDHEPIVRFVPSAPKMRCHLPAS